MRAPNLYTGYFQLETCMFVEAIYRLPHPTPTLLCAGTPRIPGLQPFPYKTDDKL